MQTVGKEPLGLYIHIPFCEKRCAYCDFYSSFLNAELSDEYLSALIERIKEWGGVINRPVSSVYIGGGTPSVIGGRIGGLMKAVKDSFNILPNAEITAEINPNCGDVFLSTAHESGVNRISIGIQSGNDSELKALGRTHTAKEAAAAVNRVKKVGFGNISADIMIGLPDSDRETLSKSIDFICGLEPRHISSYILKLEENTLLYKLKNTLNIPDDDSVADQYLYMCEALEKRGFSHYEISNFAQNGFEGRHNINYWNCGEYIGIGPSAHSFLNGKRFYYPSDIREFVRGGKPVGDGSGGDAEEYIMLRLRLSDGVLFSDYRDRFGRDIPDSVKNQAKIFEKSGLATVSQNSVSLTDKGMLVSNEIITELLECF